MGKKVKVAVAQNNPLRWKSLNFKAEEDWASGDMAAAGRRGKAPVAWC